MNEKLLEKKLREEVKKLGGLALKFSSSTYTGMPDRIVLMPGGKTYWVELKTTGKNLKANQKGRVKILEKLGQEVYVVCTEEQLLSFLTFIDAIQKIINF